MSKEVVSYMLSGMDNMKSLQVQLILQCAPFLKGILDYPIDDVKCFIEQDGKDSLFSGYWKVYNNPGRAKMIFWAYDKAKTSAVNEYLIGKSIRDIAYVAAC